MSAIHFDTSRMSALTEAAIKDIDEQLEEVNHGGDLSKVIDTIYAILARLGHDFSRTLKKSDDYLDSEIKAKVKDLSDSYRSKWTLGCTVVSAGFSIAAPVLFRGVRIEAISTVSQGLSSGAQLIEKRQEAERTVLNHTKESLTDRKRDKNESKRTQSEEIKQTERNKKDAQQAENQARMSVWRV